MKIKVNDVEVFELNETKKKVIKHVIDVDVFDQDMKRRLEWVLTHKYERCFECLKNEWMPKLAAKGVQSVPLDADAFAELVFAQPEYKDRKIKDIETKSAEDLRKV